MDHICLEWSNLPPSVIRITSASNLQLCHLHFAGSSPQVFSAKVSHEFLDTSSLEVLSIIILTKIMGWCYVLAWMGRQGGDPSCLILEPTSYNHLWCTTLWWTFDALQQCNRIQCISDSVNNISVNYIFSQMQGNEVFEADGSIRRPTKLNTDLRRPPANLRT